MSDAIIEGKEGSPAEPLDRNLSATGMICTIPVASPIMYDCVHLHHVKAVTVITSSLIHPAIHYIWKDITAWHVCTVLISMHFCYWSAA